MNEFKAGDVVIHKTNYSLKMVIMAVLPGEALDSQTAYRCRYWVNEVHDFKYLDFLACELIISK